MIRSCGHRDKQNINVETRNFSAQDAEKMRHPTSVPLSPCASSSSRRLQISVPRTALPSTNIKDGGEGFFRSLVYRNRSCEILIVHDFSPRRTHLADFVLW